MDPKLVAAEDTPTSTRTGWIRFGRGAAVYAEIEEVDDFGNASSVKKAFRADKDGCRPYDRAVQWIHSQLGEARNTRISRTQTPKM